MVVLTPAVSCIHVYLLMLFFKRRVSGIDLLYKYLQQHPESTRGREVFLLSGKQSKLERQELITMIQAQANHEHGFIVLTTFDVGGVGHNFQNISQLILLDQQWNPQVSSS